MRPLLIALGFAVASCDEHAKPPSEDRNGELRTSEVSEGTLSGRSEDVTFFKDRSNLEVTLAHQITGNKLVVTASVINRSNENITFVDHPDFWSIAVYAVDRDKDEAINSGQFFHYHKATKEDLKIVAPQEAASFERSFTVRRKPEGVTELEEYPQFSEPKSFMRIFDSHLQATFHYGAYPKRLPDEAASFARNYVMVEVGAKTHFGAPGVEQDAEQPATAGESK